MIRYIALATLLFASSAEAYSGNDLYKELEMGKGADASSYAEPILRGRGLGFTFGVASTALTLGVICSPDGLPTKQYVDISHKYLRDHPGTRHLDATSLVLTALVEAFPCKK